MAITYDAPGVGYGGYPDFETPMALYWTRWKYPLQQYGNFTAIVFGRTYAQQQAYWTAEALDTEDPYESGFYLYEESTPEYSQTGGMFQWIRWNATIPSAFDTYTFGAVTFPGYYSEWDADAPVSPATSVYRPPLTKVVRIRERHEYVMSTTPWTTFTVIPAQLIQTATMAYVNYVDDNTITNAGALSPSSGTPPTLTYAEYKTKVDGTATDTEFVCKEAEVKRAYGSGNIWEMITYYAEAE